MDKRTINTGQEEQRHGLSGRKTLIVAAAAGLSVANIYYAQPLLDLMAHDLGIPPANIGIIVTLTQIGYGMGLIFIVPIGDLIDRRKLIIVQGLLSSIALTVVATAEGKMLLLAGMCVVGCWLLSFRCLSRTPRPWQRRTNAEGLSVWLPAAS